MCGERCVDDTARFFRFRTGNSRIGLRAEGATATASETSDPAQGSGGRAYPVAVAMLRRRREFHVDSDLEVSSTAVQAHHAVSFTASTVVARVLKADQISCSLCRLSRVTGLSYLLLTASVD